MLRLSAKVSPDLNPARAWTWVPVEGARDVAACPGADRFFVDSIHDGNGLPGEFLSPKAERTEELAKAYAAARDWGATLLAGKIAAQLHVPNVRRPRPLHRFGAG